MMQLSTPHQLSEFMPWNDFQAIRVPATVYDRVLPAEKQRVFDLVLKLGLEVWAEDGELVFKLPRFRPVNGVAHAARHRWLLSS